MPGKMCTVYEAWPKVGCIDKNHCAHGWTWKNISLPISNYTRSNPHPLHGCESHLTEEVAKNHAQMLHVLSIYQHLPQMQVYKYAIHGASGMVTAVFPGTSRKKPLAVFRWRPRTCKRRIVFYLLRGYPLVIKDGHGNSGYMHVLIRITDKWSHFPLSCLITGG